MKNSSETIEEQTARDDLARAVRGGHKPTGTRLEKLRWIVEHHQAARVDGAFVDVMTARVCPDVYARIKTEEIRERFLSLTMARMGAVAWKLVK